MQPIFTLLFGEYIVAQKLNEKASVFIPISSQEKGIDLLMYNKKNKIKTIQVKSARIFNNAYKKQKNDKYQYYALFNKIEVHENVDWYMLVSMYHKYKNNFKKSKGKIWIPLILAFTNKEMKELMNNLKCKRVNKKDTKFVLGFDDDKKVFMTRGMREIKDLSQYLYNNRKKEIFNFI